MPADDFSHRISAAALARRGLARVSGHGPSWTATITQGGRDYIASANGPSPPTPRQANTSVTQELVNAVIAAGGRLRLPSKLYGDSGGADYYRRVQIAERQGKVPAGKRLSLERVSNEEIAIALVDGPEGAPHEAAPVPVPVRISRYHPLVKRFREAKRRHEVSRAALPRVLRILHGLVSEAERRGYSVSEPGSQPERYGRSSWSGASDGHLVIAVGEDVERLRIKELGLPSRTHWEQQNGRWDRWDGERKYPPLTEYEAGATGRVEVELVNSYGPRTTKWADRKSWTLEEKLPDLLHELELRAAEAVERRAAAARKAEQQRREWELAIERATERYLEDRRGEVIESEASAWRRAQLVRDYCAAVDDTGSSEAAEWAEWGSRYAERIDPLNGAVGIPADPESIPREALKPYLGRLSPYEPSGW